MNQLMKFTQPVSFTGPVGAASSIRLLAALTMTSDEFKFSLLPRCRLYASQPCLTIFLFRAYIYLYCI